MQINEHETKKITINDIAKMANVSITTVSRVLNNNEGVSKKTRRKVQQVIRSVDYTPSDIARGLATNSSNTIGLLIPDIMNSYYAELIRSIEAKISAAGFSLLLCITNEEAAKEEAYINDMIRRRVSGLIILSTKIESEALLKRMNSAMKVVSVDADIPGVDRISVESEQGTYRMIRHLLECGHRKIGFIGYQFGLSSLQKRLKGYYRALEEYGVPVQQKYVMEGCPTGNPGYELTLKMLDLADPPTAIHCINEYCASGAYMALAERGVKIPQGMSVTAFDGLQASRLLVPKLTTMAMPVYAMGEAAAQLLIQSILGEDNRAHKEYMFPVEFIDGESVKNRNA